MGISAADILALRSKTSAGMGLCKEALVAANGNMEEAVKYVNDRSDVIGRLHNATGAKIGLAKIAFNDAGQDFEKAIEIINKRGWAQEIEAGSVDGPKEGIIGVYVHGTDQKTVAMVEVTCQTDFVQKNEKFREFAKILAVQVAAMKPEFVSKENISAEKIAELKETFTIEAKAEGKPENVIEKIIEGKMNKYYEEKCLMSQKWFKDESKTMANLLDEYVFQIGEPMTVRRLWLVKFGE